MNEFIEYLDTLVGPRPVKKYGFTYKYNTITRMYDKQVKDNMGPWEVN